MRPMATENSALFFVISNLRMPVATAESSQSSERRAHAELQYPWKVLHVRAGRRLPEVRVAGIGDVGAVVLVIKQIEDLHDPVDGHAAGERQPLLQPQVYLMNRFADEGVPRDDRPVGAQAQVTGVRAGTAFIAQVEPGISPEPLAGAEEVDPAHLEAGGDLPDPVDDGPMALVTRIHEPTTALPAGETIFPTHIGCQRERDWPSHHDAVVAEGPLWPEWLRVPEEPQRVARAGLPAVAEPLGQREIRAVIVRPAFEELEVHLPPLGEATMATVGERT